MKYHLYLSKSTIIIGVLALCFNCMFLSAQVGIGTTDPKSQLDVNGGLSLREGAAMTVSNGINTDILLGTNPSSTYRITGATAAFSVTGMEPPAGSDGLIVTLINTTAVPMTLLNDLGTSVTNGIKCPGLKNLVLTGSYATITVQYNATEQRWIVLKTADTRYGDNIQSVIGTTNIGTNSSTFADMEDMEITFIPNHSVVYLTFSASGSMNTSTIPEQVYADFRLVNVTDSNAVLGGTSTLVTDFDTDDILGSGVAVSWNAQIAMFPVAVTPGVSTTLKMQWMRDGLLPRRLTNKVAGQSDSSHRSMTIFD